MTCFNEPHCSKPTQRFSDSRTTYPVIFRSLFYRFYTISWGEFSILYSLTNFVSDLLIRCVSFNIFLIHSLPPDFLTIYTRLRTSEKKIILFLPMACDCVNVYVFYQTGHQRTS